MSSFLSKAWFGIVTNENDMSATYRRLLDFKSTSYTIVGKLRDNNDDMILIKFLLIFEEEVDFHKVTKGRYADVFNTIIPIEPSQMYNYIDLIKKITFLQSGIDPVTKLLIDDERYYSSDDSEYRGSSEDEDDDDDEDYTIDDEMYFEEKRIEYSEMTLLTLQKSLLEYVDRKNLTLCEYLTTAKISEFLGYS